MVFNALRLSRTPNRAAALWRPFRVALELFAVVIAGLYASQNYINSNPQMVLVGFEAQWLTSSAYLASNTLHDDGYIPLWEPYLGYGEPAIEGAFSFTLNPISTVPSLLFGAENGIKYSVVAYAVFVGLGGWLLARVLGLNGLGRLFLALVCIGRGNMHSDLSAGYFQLGVTQAYFPWVAAGAIAIYRYDERRWPLVLLAVSLTLLFWGGNIYYTLPMLIVVILLGAVFATRLDNWALSYDPVVARRFALALAMTAGLAAVTLLPTFLNQGLIGGHPNELPDAAYESAAVAAVQFFTSQRFYTQGIWQENYFSYVLPLPFALLILLFLPITVPQLHRLALPRLHKRVFVGGALLILLFFTWGTRTNPLITWAYENLPLIGQWRVLARMLTVASFWIGVLAAMRLDGLWRALVDEKRLSRWLKIPNLHRAMAVILLIGSGWAAKSLLDSWFLFSSIDEIEPSLITCVDWLHAQRPNEPISVFGNDYWSVAVYINRQIRFPHINADYAPSGLPPTLYPHDLRDMPPRYGRLSRDELYVANDVEGRNPPEYLIPNSETERQFWLARGYDFVRGSPLEVDSAPCLMRNPNTLSYAFSIPVDGLDSAPYPLPPDLTTPITQVTREPGVTALVAQAGTQPVVVVAQELAWPGWRVTVDDASARIESFGGMVGVVLPPDGAEHRVLFVYDPPLFRLGGLITLGTALACALYLLGADKPITRRIETRLNRQDAGSGMT